MTDTKKINASTQTHQSILSSSLREANHFDEAKGNASKFLASIEDIAEKLMETESYNTQEINFNTNNGDETLYMR